LFLQNFHEGPAIDFALSHMSWDLNDPQAGNRRFDERLAIAEPYIALKIQRVTARA